MFNSCSIAAATSIYPMKNWRIVSMTYHFLIPEISGEILPFYVFIDRLTPIITACRQAFVDDTAVSNNRNKIIMKIT
ncbi:unnamed protein product [Adineta steineri]|uniref:Uncharacterized protein n=1 Tax=Adineta steineri TaxID=433720 RepID=A0A819LKW9_9BILA|nr:unnamed protein product [Adineta steineri]